jgi:hypothetical protein
MLINVCGGWRGVCPNDSFLHEVAVVVVAAVGCQAGLVCHRVWLGLKDILTVSSGTIGPRRRTEESSELEGKMFSRYLSVFVEAGFL